MYMATQKAAVLEAHINRVAGHYGCPSPASQGIKEILGKRKEITWAVTQPMKNAQSTVKNYPRYHSKI
jgi:hypothetical protein